MVAISHFVQKINTIDTVHVNKHHYTVTVITLFLLSILKVQQLLSTILLNYCSVKRLSNYCTVW